MDRALRYSVLKFVPDPVRDEAVNLGLVMAATDESWFRAEFLRTFAKVRALGGLPAVAYARALVRDLEAEVPMDGSQSRLFLPAERLDSLLANVQSSDRRSRGRVRATEPHAAVTDNPDELFEDLFRELIGRPGRRPLTAAQVDQKVLMAGPGTAAQPAPRTRDELKKVFKDRALVDWELQPSRLSEEGVEGTVPHRVDFGLYNGALRSVVHTVSFAVEPLYVEYQRAVLAETALDLRSLGRKAVDFTMLYVPAPADDETLGHLELATLRFMQRQDIAAVPGPDVDQLADQVRSLAH